MRQIHKELVRILLLYEEKYFQTRKKYSSERALRTCHILGWLKNSLHFMEPIRSLPYSQQPALVPILSKMDSVLASPSLMFKTVLKNIFISSAINYALCLLQ